MEEEGAREPTQTMPGKEKRRSSTKIDPRWTSITSHFFLLCFDYLRCMQNKPTPTKQNPTAHAHPPQPTSVCTHPKPKSNTNNQPPSHLLLPFPFPHHGSNLAVTRKRRFGGGASTSKALDCCACCGRIWTPTFVSPARLCAWKRARTGMVVVVVVVGDEDANGNGGVGPPSSCGAVEAAGVRGRVALRRSVVPGLSSSGRVHCRSDGGA